MQLYRIFRFQGDAPAYASTLAAAKTSATRDPHRRDISLGRVELIDVQLDKATLVLILNGAHPSSDRLRTWKVTSRGGLLELGKDT